MQFSNINIVANSIYVIFFYFFILFKTNFFPRVSISIYHTYRVSSHFFILYFNYPSSKLRVDNFIIRVKVAFTLRVNCTYLSLVIDMFSELTARWRCVPHSFSARNREDMAFSRLLSGTKHSPGLPNQRRLNCGCVGSAACCVRSCGIEKTKFSGTAHTRGGFYV